MTAGAMTLIEVRPHRWGWQVFEENSKELTKPPSFPVPHAEIQKRETQWKNGRKQHTSHHRHR